jgi:DUF917 family protein
MKTLDKQDLRDIMVGSAYLGTGGGGLLDVGWKNIEKALADGREFKLIDVSEMGDDDYASVPYEIGTLAKIPPSEREKFKDLPTAPGLPTSAAYKALADFMGKTFTSVIVGELGPESTASALICAADMKLFTLDADVCGRAAPQVQQHSVRVSGHSLLPAGAATTFGDEIILKKVAVPEREEEIFRVLAEANIWIGVSDAPIPGHIAKQEGVLVTGSVSLCLKVGAAYREACDAKGDAIGAARDAANGYTLFEGTITKIDQADKGGFLVGGVTLAGTGANDGMTCRIDYKNENMVARIDDQVIATVPDLITLVDKQSGLPPGNPNFESGQEMVVLGFKCPDIWRTAAGLEVFSPQHFGFKVDYVPIEKRMMELKTMLRKNKKEKQ